MLRHAAALALLSFRPPQLMPIILRADFSSLAAFFCRFCFRPDILRSSPYFSSLLPPRDRASCESIFRRFHRQLIFRHAFRLVSHFHSPPAHEIRRHHFTLPPFFTLFHYCRSQFEIISSSFSAIRFADSAIFATLLLIFAISIVHFILRFRHTLISFHSD